MTNITHDEWQIELERSYKPIGPEPEGAATVAELGIKLKQGRAIIRRMIAKGLATGRIKRVEVHRPDSMGRYQRVPAYVLKKDETKTKGA